MNPRRTPHRCTHWHALILMLACAGAGAEEAIVAQAAPAATASPASSENIVVIGSSRAVASAGLDSTAPVRLISAQDLQDTGASTLNEALSRLEPSFEFPQGQNAVKGMGIRSAELRGVSPAYTLVLVNGKRRHTTAQLTGTDPWPAATVVDLNAIPIAAIERVEVLKDGAAAQYGSDAIAGVVNIVLKSRSQGGDAEVRTGGYTDGGGLTAEANLWKGLRIGSKGSLTLSANFLDSGQVDRTAPDWRRLFPLGDPRAGVARPDQGWEWGQGGRLNGSVLANGSLPVNDWATAYAWLGYSRASTNNTINPERVVKTNNNPAPAILAQDGPTAPTLVNQYSDPWLYPNGYQPNTTYVQTDPSAAAGVKLGDVEDTVGAWDVAVTWGSSQTRRWVDNDANPSWGPSSPTHADLGAWRARQWSVSADGVKALSLPGLKDPVLLNGGVLARHEFWGVGEPGDAWTYTAGPLASQGITRVGQLYAAYPQLLPAGLSPTTLAAILADRTLIPSVSDFPGIWPVDIRAATRRVRGAYIGAEVTPIERVQLAATGRYENYSDFGDTLNGKVTGRFDWSPAVALRGTVSTGFHAPSLAELAFQSTGYTGTLVNGGGSSAQVLGLTRQFAPSDPAAAVFGARALKPERSNSYSLGLVLRPSATFSLTVDAYDLKVHDAIQVSESLSGNGTGPAPATGTVIGNLFSAEGLAGFTTTSYYLNAWDQVTRGIDAVALKHIDAVGAGAVELSAAFSVIDTYVPPDTVRRTGTIGGNVFTLISNAKIRDIQFGTPHDKAVLSARYTVAAWTAEATVTRFGHYRYDINATNGAHDQEFAPETYLDLDFVYRFTPRVRVEFGSKNVLNKYPDPYDPGNRQSGVNKYSFIAPNGAAGRFVYAGLGYSL